jgi:beta-glucosidase-like glycosyl hydrolase
LGYRGVIVSDSLTTVALDGLGSPERLAVMAAGAGIDLMIFDGLDATRVRCMDALAGAAASASVPRGQLEASVRRALSERESIAHS